MGHIVNLGSEIQAQITYHEIELLAKENEDGKLSCEMSQFDTCIHGKLVQMMEENFGCTTPWFVGNNSRICTDPEKVRGSFDIMYTRSTNQMNDCNVPCHRLETFVSGKNTDTAKTENETKINLYFQPSTMISEEHILYTAVSLFAEIGGYMGLLLGYSLLSFAQTIGEFIERKMKTQ